MQQIGIVNEYQTKFFRTLSRSGKLPQQQKVTCFVTGLKPNIRSEVLSRKPKTLFEAICLALLFNNQKKPNSMIGGISNNDQKMTVTR